jgi:hypothetical protein
MVGLLVRCDNPQRHILDQTPLDLSPGTFPDRVRIDQQRDHHRRVTRGATSTVDAIRSAKCRQVQLGNRVHHEPREMITRKPVRYRRRHQHQLVTIDYRKVVGHPPIASATTVDREHETPKPTTDSCDSLKILDSPSRYLQRVTGNDAGQQLMQPISGAGH